jgi:hypothetical protein
MRFERSLLEDIPFIECPVQNGTKINRRTSVRLTEFSPLTYLWIPLGESFLEMGLRSARIVPERSRRWRRNSDNASRKGTLRYATWDLKIQGSGASLAFDQFGLWPRNIPYFWKRKVYKNNGANLWCLLMPLLRHHLARFLGTALCHYPKTHPNLAPTIT